MVSETKKRNYELEIDRDLAIKKAMLFAKKDDIILLLGKGLENYQLTNGIAVPIKTDVETAYKYAEELFSKQTN